MEEVQVTSDFNLVGQLRYEPTGGKIVDGAGIRLYQGVNPANKNCQYICVENGDTGEEAWYRIDGVQLVPVSLRGLEKLPRDPR